MIFSTDMSALNINQVSKPKNQNRIPKLPTQAPETHIILHRNPYKHILPHGHIDTQYTHIHTQTHAVCCTLSYTHTQTTHTCTNKHHIHTKYTHIHTSTHMPKIETLKCLVHTL
jgi:hypothetical protein